jgi:hypothetical protein
MQDFFFGEVEMGISLTTWAKFFKTLSVRRAL